MSATFLDYLQRSLQQMEDGVKRLRHHAEEDLARHKRTLEIVAHREAEIETLKTEIARSRLVMEEAKQKKTDEVDFTHLDTKNDPPRQYIDRFFDERGIEIGEYAWRGRYAGKDGIRRNFHPPY